MSICFTSFHPKMKEAATLFTVVLFKRQYSRICRIMQKELHVILRCFEGFIFVCVFLFLKLIFPFSALTPAGHFAGRRHCFFAESFLYPLTFL